MWSMLKNMCNLHSISSWWVFHIITWIWWKIEGNNLYRILIWYEILFTEVARTRLREEGSRYKSFWQTLGIVYREEGRRGLYRGLATQLVRQIPNTAIMMSTYELTVYVLTKWFVQSPEQDPSKGGKN